MATKKKKPSARKKQTQPTSLIAVTYQFAQKFNCSSDYTQNKDAEVLTVWCRNTYAEKIVVSRSRFDAGESSIEMYRITGGERYPSLQVVSANGSRVEASALAIIKAELQRYC